MSKVTLTEVNGWKVLFHPLIIDQMQKLKVAQTGVPPTNANAKLYTAISRLIYEIIPNNPGGPEFRQGKTLSSAYKHWRRAKFFGRFRLFFRYDSRSKTIVYVWVNDENTLRQSGAKTDAYAVFKGMLNSGNPPDTFAKLMSQSKPMPK